MDKLSEAIVELLCKKTSNILDLESRVKIFCDIISPISLEEKGEIFENILCLHKYGREDKDRIRLALIDFSLIRNCFGKYIHRDLLIVAKNKKLLHLFCYLDGRENKKIQLTDNEKDHLIFRDAYSFLDIPLGRRKEMARKIKRRMIDRFVFDQDPSVIENLLINPLLVEQDVLKIASLRPTNGTISLVIMKNLKWSSYYRVKKAIIFNPYTPCYISVSLLYFLNNVDLKFMVSEKFLSPSLIESARMLLGERGIGI